jgi:hypothetical protein
VRYFKYGFLIFILAVPVGIVTVVLMMFQDFPLVSSRVKLSHQDIARAKSLLKQHDPRRLRKGEVRTLAVSESDLNRAGNYVLNRFGRGRARFKILLDPGMMLVQGTLQLPKNPLGNYINIKAVLSETESLPKVEQVQVGSLPVPGFLTELGFGYVVEGFNMQKEFKLAQDTLRDASFSPNRLRVTYSWSPEIINVARARILPEKDQKLIQIYQSHLATIAQEFNSGQSVSLARLLTPMFKHARDRSESGNPIDENKAVITVLAAYINRLNLAKLSPATEKIKPPRPLTIVLRDRKDLAQHFITSSALAFAGGSGFSNAVGIFKEISDSRGGSGFSFADLAADLSGTRFGKLSTKSRQSARQVQRRLSILINESFIQPDIKGLPEAMSENNFRRRFGGTSSPAYIQMLSNIQASIRRCGLYQP